MKRKTEKIDSIEKFWREWDNANELKKIEICKPLAKNFMHFYSPVKLHKDKKEIWIFHFASLINSYFMDLQDYEVGKNGRK